jgi:hypothetical protein
LIDNTYVSQKESSVAVNTFLWRKPNQKQLEFWERIVSYLNGLQLLREAAPIIMLVQHAPKSHQGLKGIFSDRSTGFSMENLRVKKRPKKTNHSKTITSY